MAFIKVETIFGDLKVQIVTQNPDLYVYLTKSRTEAGGKDENWCYVDYGYDKKVIFVDKKDADLKIQFVEEKEQAGWVNKTHRLYKRLCL